MMHGQKNSKLGNLNRVGYMRSTQ